MPVAKWGIVDMKVPSMYVHSPPAANNGDKLPDETRRVHTRKIPTGAYGVCVYLPVSIDCLYWAL
jgi:hypothetical protein